jgi:hypothetical protein
MSNRQKIYGKGRIEGAWTAVRHEVLNSAAWKHTSPGARLLYIALLRNLSFRAYNNGKLFLATRRAADELGASQRIVCIWFRELEHYGFVEMTEPGSVGPKGRATRWRITDMNWGELDGKPIRSTKDYLQWTGELFERRPKKQKNGEQKYSARRPKVLTSDDQKYSATPATDDQKYSEGNHSDREQKYSDLAQPSPPREAEARPLPVEEWQRNSKLPAERLDCPNDGSLPTFMRRGHPDCPWN